MKNIAGKIKEDGNKNPKENPYHKQSKSIATDGDLHQFNEKTGKFKANLLPGKTTCIII